MATGGADVDADMATVGEMTGARVTAGVEMIGTGVTIELVSWGVTNDDNDAGLLVIL